MRRSPAGHGDSHRGATPLNGEKTPEERAGLLVWYLAHGYAFKTQEAARLTGLTHRGALRLLSGLSRILPIYQDDFGLWCVLAMREVE